MESVENEVVAFKIFANKTMKNHLDELNTRYRERPIDPNVVRQAYHEHQAILERELADRIDAIISSEKNQMYVKESLDRIKEDMLSGFVNGIEKLF